MRVADRVSQAVLVVAIIILAVGWVIAQVPPPDASLGAVNQVRIQDLSKRVDRLELVTDKRFERLESMGQYGLIGLFLNLGAHGIQIRSSLRRRRRTADMDDAAA